MKAYDIQAKVLFISRIPNSEAGVTVCQAYYCQSWPTHLVRLQVKGEEYTIGLCEYHAKKFKRETE